MNAKSHVDTKTAHRRSFRLRDLDDLRAEVKTLCEASHVRQTGNWTLAQALDHIACLMEGSLDGVSAKAPLWLRMMSPLFRSKALNTGMDPGIKLTGAMEAALPPDDVSLEAARKRIENVFTRIRDGERMTHPSPVFGKMTHEDWTNFHCRHAELHLSFHHPQ